MKIYTFNQTKIRKYILSIILFSLFSISITAQTQQQRFDQLFQETLSAIKAKNHDLVIAKSTKLIRMAPKQSQPYYIRGTSYIAQKNYINAVADFTSAIDKGISDPKLKRLAYVLRALSNRNLDKIDAAISDYTEAIDLGNPTFQDYAMRADLYIEKKDFRNSVKDSTKSIKLKSDYFFPFFLRSRAYFEIGELKKALKDADRSIELKSDGTNIYKLRAEINRKLGNIDQAESDLNRYAELSGNSVVRNKLVLSDEEVVKLIKISRTFVDEENWKSAIVIYNQLIDGVDENSELLYSFYFLRGRANYKLGEFDKSIADHSKTSQLAPDLYTNYTLRGESYLKKNELENARKDFDKAISIEPTDILAFRRRAEVFYLQSDFKKSIADSTTVLKLDASYATGWFFRGISYYELGEDQKALSDLTEYLKLIPDDIQIYLIRARIYRNLGKPELASADEEKAKMLENEKLQ